MEDYGTGQQGGIMAGLDYETVNAMKAAETNWNDDFMSAGGENTGKWQKYNNQNENNSTGENLSGIAQGVTNSAQLINNIITPNLTTYVSSYISEVVMTYMSEAMVSMLSFDGSMIINKAMSIMPTHLLSAGAIMNELLKTNESMTDELINNTLTDLTDSINKVIGDKVKVVTDEINKNLEKVNDEIGSIAFYATQGPAFVQQKIDLSIKKTIETCFKNIAKARDGVNTEKEKIIDSIANKKAEELANKANDQIRQQTKDKLDQVNQKKKDAINKAKTVIINAKLKLMALMGG